MFASFVYSACAFCLQPVFSFGPCVFGTRRSPATLSSEGRSKHHLCNTAIDVLMRDGKMSEEDAYEEAKNILPDLMGQFENFLTNFNGMIYKQVTPVLGKHGIHIKDANKMLSPKIERVREFREGIGMIIHFERPDTSSTIDNTPSKEYDSSIDSMYG